MPANVPLLKPALDLIKKYNLNKGNNSRYTVFPFVTNKDINSNIKVISEVCELGISINFYVARHTFASTVTLSNGVSITSIKQMMGHKKIESTLHYARTNNIEIANEMKLAQQRMDIKSQNNS
jgi:integrase/recombinase XerD